MRHNKIRALCLSERAPSSHQTSNMRGSTSHLLHLTCSYCIISLPVLILRAGDLDIFFSSDRNLTTDSLDVWESLWHLVPVVRELLQNQVLVTHIGSSGTRGQTLSWWDNSSFLVFLSMLSRESVIFLYVDIGLQAQKTKSKFL